MTASDRRWSNSSNHSDSTKFPDFDHSQYPRERLSIQEEDSTVFRPNGRTPSPNKPIAPRPNGILHSQQRWAARRESLPRWNHTNNAGGGFKGHNRQKSLSDAIRTIRTRRGSVAANAHEIADALKAPVSYRLVILCLIWYFSSALTNTSTKSILNAFPKPITLTLIQFAFVSSWCLVLAQLARHFPMVRRTVPALKNGLRKPTREVITTTLPLALFQLFGHILSSTATSKIPVSLVHTIKGLSPLFTVLAYRLIFHIHYSPATYLSLIPLTLGVILACSVEFSGNVYGILCAFLAALVFVSQNIFSKKLFNEAARVEAEGYQMPSQSTKLDKLNLLCYCSALAFLLNLPLWLWTEGFYLIHDVFRLGALPISDKPTALDHGRLTLEFFFNGIFHFGQNIMAFVLLSMVSPVTYSVASLIKRVFVILAAIIWFGNSTSRVQAIGIGLTFLGLYLYDRTSVASKADRRAKMVQMGPERPLLPLTTDGFHGGHGLQSAAVVETPVSMSSGHVFANGRAVSGEEKRHDSAGPGRVPTGMAEIWTASNEAFPEEDWKGRESGPIT